MAKPTNKNRRKHQRRQAERLVFEDLEPRVLLSADPLAVAIADSLDAGLTEQPAPVVALMDVPEAPRLDAGLDPTSGVQAPDPLDLDGVASLMDEDASDETSVELIFIDPHVEDYQQLIDGLAEDPTRSFEVVVLDAERDGIEQISEALSSKEGIDAIHVISHGSEAGVQIGGTWLTAENLSSYATEISGWSDSLDADADLLLYGCDLAASADGLTLLEGLAEISGADVAASEDLTGSASLGGDWDLERQVGDIEAQIAIGKEMQQTWSGLLALPNGTAIWSEGGSTVSQTNDWDGSGFVGEATGADTGQYVTMVGAESPTRDEKIIVGMDASGTISGQVWDGTAWAPISMQMQAGAFNTNGVLATVTPSDLSSFDVVYQQGSGNAMLVWDNGGGGFNLSYSIWDGTSWKQEGQLNPSVGGNFVELDLVASPNSDEVFLVSTTDANRNPDYAMFWDPTASAWYEFGSTLENTDDGFTDASVAYEQQSGRALIVYGDSGDGSATDVSAKIWDGSTLTDISSVAAPAGITGTVEWTELASDPNSDRIALAVRTTNNEGWVSVWNGTAWETSVMVADAGAGLGGNSQANIDVAFEAESGEALVTYGAQNSTQLRYRTWDTVGGWSGEYTDLDFGLTTNSLTLEAAPFSDGIALMIQNSSRQLTHAYWDGDAWVSSVQLETSTGSNPDTQPFVFLWDQGNLPPEIDSHGGADTVDLSVVENSAAVTQVTAKDPNGDPITYTLYGDDASLFTIDAAGNLSFSAAPDYENPQDLNGDNTYIVEVRAEDPSGAWDSQLFNVSVKDVEGHLVIVDTDSDFVDGDTSSIEMLNANPGLDGFISLREAILAANATTNDLSGPDQIWFDIATADHTISLSSALPNITDAVIIDGFSEPAYVSGGQLIVEIDGSGAGAIQAGLVLEGGSSTIQGLVFNNIDGDGILVTSTAGGSRIVGNFIGTDAFGETAIGNTGIGIRVDNAAGVQIGGTLLEDRNIIAGNGSSGILLGGVGTLDTVIQGNYIGVDIDGQTALGNGKNGIDVIGDAHQNLIEGNIIGGSSGAGIRLSGSAVQDNVIIGNYIGTNSSYDDLGNAAHGVLIENGASNNTIGDVGGGNLIAYNKAEGVLVTGNTSVGNSLLGNEIFANVGAEIKLDGGGNNAQTAPVLTAAEYDGATLNIYGELTSTPNTTFHIEFFVVSATNADPSGAGGAEGYVYYDTVTTDNTGFASFSFGVPTSSVSVGDYITAIATVDNAGDLTDSSAFSQNVKIAVPNNPPTTSGIADVTVDEDAPDTVIDLFAAFDDAEDVDSALTFTQESISSPGLFAATAIDGLAGSLTLQYAADAFGTSDITIRATDTGGKFVETTFTVTVNAVNDAPTDLALDNATVVENTDGAVIGNVSVTDPDAGDTHVFTVDDARFEVVGGQLKLKAGQSLDHEAEPTVNVTITATDQAGAGLSYNESFSITVTDVNEAPTDLALSNATVGENADGAVVGAVSVSDPDASDTHTFAVDDARFEVVGGQLKLKAGQSLDHETEPTVSVTITATDQAGTGLSYNESFTVTVADVNEAPTDLALSNTTVAENADGAVVGTVSVSDPDASDTHTFTVDDARFEIVGGQLKLKAGQSLDHEAEPTVNVTITAIDQGGSGLSYNESFTLTVTDVTELPTANIIPATYAADEQVALTLDGTGMQVSAPDAGNNSVTVTLSVGEGVINASAGTTTVTVNNSGTASVTLTGTVDQINALLDGAGTVEYFNGLDAPSATTTLTLAIDDGVNAGTVSDTATINIASATDLPSVTLPGGGYNATEQTPLVLHGTGISVDAPDAGGNDVTVTLTVVEGEINVDPGPTGVGIVGSGSDTVTLSGSVNEINALLASDGSSGTIEYYNASDVPSASTTLTVTVADGINAAVNEVTTIDIAPVNDAPTAVNDAAYMVDEDGSLNVPAANGVLVNDFDPEGDPLTAILVTGPSNEQSFTLNADGSFDYTPLADFNGTDSFTYTVNDGSVDGNTATAYITVTPVNDPPSLSLSTTSVGYTEDAATPTVLDAGLTISDPDDTQLSAAQITITDFVAGDVLGFDTTGTSISASYDGATGVLILTGTDSIANYEQVLRTVAFSSTSDDPTLADTQTSRSLLWEIIDADADGSGWQETDSASSSIVVGAANDAPTATILQSSYNVVEDTPIMLSGTGMSVADADAGSNIVQASLSAGAGSVFTVDPGTTGVVVSGSGSSVTFEGTITAINDLLAGNMSASIYYEAPQNPVSGSLITLAIVDQGNTGTGGSQAGSDAASLNITASNDPPVVNVLIPSVTAQEDMDQAVTGITIGDPDADTGDLVVTLSVSNGTLSAVAPASVSVAGGGTASMTLTGPLTDLNAALGTLVYRGDADYVGGDTLTIDVNDQGNTGPDGPKTDSGSVAITVAAQNDLPQAVDDAYSVDEDSSISSDVSVNDTGLGDGGIVYAVVPGSEPTNGTLLFNPDGSFTYTPDADFNGSDSFTYSVTDVDGDSATATVTLTVNPINDLPVPIDDTNTASEGGSSVGGNVLLNDSAPDTPATVTAADESGTPIGIGSPYTTAAGGQIVINSDGSYSYTPPPQGAVPAAGLVEGFSYTITDADGDSATASLTINVVNSDAGTPSALADSFTVDEGATFDTTTGDLLASGSASVLGNDGGLTDTPITVSLVSGVSYGTLSLNVDGTFVYSHDGTENFSDSFTYRVTDDDGQSSDAIVNITINAINETPTTTGIANVTVDEDALPTVINLALAFSDAEDPASALTYSLVGNTNPALFSSVAIDQASDELTLTYAADANGIADLTVRATDSGGQFVDASFTVTVNPVDDLPVAVDDAVSVDEDGIVSASVAGNDTGLGDGPVVYALVGGSGPNNGLLTFNPDGSFIYAPDLNYSGSDGFSYTVTDADGDTATATVTLTINPLNDLPNPVDDSNVASEGGSAVTGNVMANDSSPDAPTTVTAADESGTAIVIGTPYTTAAGGELILNSDGSYSYTPPSQGQVPVAGLIESFTYSVTDGNGDTATAVLSITVDNSDLSLPQAVADALTVTEGGSFDTLAGDLLASGSASLLGNDTGLTDTPISVSLVSDVSHGTLILNADGSIVYTHDGSENLADGFTYRITDDDGQTSDASVSINVTPVNDNAPVVTSAATASVAEGDTAVLQVMVSDADLPGDTLSFGIAATGADGALFQIDGSGNLSFISTPDFEAPADANGDNVYEVGVEVFDGVHTTIQDISVTVTAVNDNAPVITSAATAAVAEGDTAVLQVMASDADLPGDTLSFAIAGSGADDALFQIDGSGNLSFISAPDYENPADADVNNLYEVDVEVSDGVNTTTQSITVDVTPVNDHVPVITSTNVVDVAENTSAVLTVTAEDDDLPGDSLSFAIAATGVDDGLFQIDAVTGALSFIAAPDYEAPADANGDNVYEVDVEVFDGVNTGTQSITVNVTPVNDNAPVITSPLNVSVPENTSAVTQVTVTDDDVPVDTLNITIAGTGADDGLFQIDGSGNLSFIAAPDFENPADADANNVYEVDISVTDGVNTTVETLTVTVDDGNEPPAAPDQVFAISEGASNGALVGQVTASDPESGNLSFAIVAGDPSGAFAINAANGRITVADATLLDHEARPQVILTVEVTDDGVPALSVYPQVTINVTDVNEAPVDIGLWDPVTGTFDYSVEENTDSSGGAVFRDLVTSDPDAGDTHSYAIVGGADAGKFTLSGNRLTLNDGVLDYERQSSYAVTIRSTDAGGLFIERTLTLVVNDLNDAPVITSTASASIFENATAATTLTATDQDGDTLSYFISGGADQALFAVDPVTGEVSFIAAPDYENPLDADVNNIYEVQVAAGDGVASASQLITISVADGADAPSGVLLSNATVSGQTDTTGGLAVGTLSAVDDDAGDTASFSIVGGADAASFQVGGASGNDLILDDGVLDASVQSSYQVTVRATDSTSRTFDQTLVVTVEPYVPPVVVEPDPVDEPAPPPAEEPAPDPDPTTSETGSGETAAETATESLNEENTVEGGGIHSPAEDSGSTSDSPSAPAVNLADTDADAGTADTQVALADIPNFATAGLDSSAGLQGSASGFVGGTITDPNSVSQTDATVEVDPVIQQLVEPGEFVQELNQVRETVTDQKIVIEKTVVGSTVVASTGLSVGYVLWLVRGGVLISSLLSSLPAWRIIDPLPVLAYASDDDEDEESLESMVKSDTGDADKDQEELPERELPHRPAPQPSGAA